MDDKLKEALEMLEHLHAAVWVHFDPSFERGDKDQPKNVKAVMKKARNLSAKLGHRFDGF